MTSSEDMLADMEQEEEVTGHQAEELEEEVVSESSLSPQKPRQPRETEKGPPLSTSKTQSPGVGGNERGVSARLPPPELTYDPTKPPLVQPQKDLRDVPTTLEGVLAVESEGKSANEVLGVLVAAHERRAMAILQRTRVQKEDVLKIAKGFQLAKHGIGGRNPALNQPIPDVSEWILTIVETLPSVGGQSREEFVNAWGKSQEERRLQRLEEEKRRSQYMGT